MKKKLISSLLLMAMLTSCELPINQQKPSSSTSSTNSSTTSFTSSSSTSSTSVSNSVTSSSTNIITSSSSVEDDDDLLLDSSSSFVERDYISSTNVDTEKYPYINSIGVKRGEAHNAYQVLVYSFYDSDGDGYGDLKGVEQKLDYIKGLGSDIVWLSPIMPSESYHAYDVLSFYDIDEKLGTLEDYISLVNTAHSKNMKIVLDMPINHTSTNHEWFRAFLNGDENYQDFYQQYNPDVENGTTSSMGSTATFYVNREHQKTYFAAFGASMPDLNFQSENVVNAIKNVFEYWVELGADGFRFDAVKHVFDPNEIPKHTVNGEDKTWDKSVEMNKQLFKDLSAHIKRISPDLYLLGENYSGQYEVALYADSFDAEFDFDSWHTSLGAVTNKDPWNASERRKYYDDTIVGNSNELISLNSDWIPTFMTGNHDVTRAATYIGDRVRDDDKAFKLYAAMLTLRSGIPFIYYGDEIGMTGSNKSGDGFVEDAEIRMPMQFEDSTINLKKMFYTRMTDANTGKVSLLGSNVMKDLPNYKTENPTVEASIADENSLYNTYKDLIAFRNSQPAIYDGTMGQSYDFTGGTVMSFNKGSERVYVAFNFSERSVDLGDFASGSMNLLYAVNGASVSGTTLKLPARGVAVLSIDGSINLTPSETLGDFDNAGETSGEAPLDGYALEVHAASGKTYYVPLTPVDEFEGFSQHFADNIKFEEGDVFILYDCNNSVGWIEDTLNPYSTEGWEVVADGIRCTQSGTYDIYVKFKWEADEVYIGPAEG